MLVLMLLLILHTSSHFLVLWLFSVCAVVLKAVSHTS